MRTVSAPGTARSVTEYAIPVGKARSIAAIEAARLAPPRHRQPPMYDISIFLRVVRSVFVCALRRSE